MPFELIVQSAFTERLAGGGVRVRNTGEHITDPEQVAALDGHSHVVRVAVAEAPPSKPPAPAKPPATLPADAPAKN